MRTDRTIGTSPGWNQDELMPSDPRPRTRGIGPPPKIQTQPIGGRRPLTLTFDH